MLDEYKKCIEACYLLDWPPESPDSWYHLS